ncbi:hypothetical protein LP417_13960 [Polaromonas sp. P1-6]|nr:hypothetical protein LP417_13960 [Polaromonas sp. P1-6]
MTWISATGARTTLEGDVRLGDDGLPDGASLKLLKGNLQGLEATLKRQDKDPEKKSRKQALNKGVLPPQQALTSGRCVSTWAAAPWKVCSICSARLWPHRLHRAE